MSTTSDRDLGIYEIGEDLSPDLSGKYTVKVRVDGSILLRPVVE